MTKIKPILRYAGSKYNKLDVIASKLNMENAQYFIDLFGGSGIVGVNMRHNFDVITIINDYDLVLKPLDTEKVMDNMLRYDGYGSYSQAAHDYFIRRINNGYGDKFDNYKSILDNCIIGNADVINQSAIWNMMHGLKNDKVRIYVDPPYGETSKLYKNHFSKSDHIKLRNKLEMLIQNKPDIKILISYNDVPEIKELYKNGTIETEEYQYRGGNNMNRKKVAELGIKNY